MSNLLTGNHLEMVLGVGSWTICSAGMLVFNKLAINVFPLECTLVGIQMATCVLAMVIFCGRSIHIGSFKDVMRWSMVVPLFTGMLLTSILALKASSMTLVVTMRALSPVFSLVIERFYPNPVPVSAGVVISIGMLVLGTGLYLTEVPKGDLTGVGWVLLNMLLGTGDRLLQRLMLAKDQRPVDISKTGVTFLNNLLGLVPILLAAWVTGELGSVRQVSAGIGLKNWALVAASCVVSVGISYCGIWAQSLITATSFLVLVNANKFFVIFLEVYVMHTLTLRPVQAMGAIIAILAGVSYGRAKQALEEEPKKASLSTEDEVPEVQPLLPKQA